MQTFRIYLLLALAALAILVLNNRNKTVAIENKHTSEVKKYQAIQKDYKAVIIHYKSKTDSLNRQLVKTQDALSKQTQISRIAGQKLRKVLSDRPAQKGDSLYDAASEYQVESEQTDSLQEGKITELENLNRNKDETIAGLSQCYDEVTGVLTSTLDDLKTCEKVNQKLTRKANWQRVKDTALIILTTAIGTITAIQILK